MCPARLVDAADVEIRLEQAYSAPSLRPICLTWCRLCTLHRCSRPGHVTLAFWATAQDEDGVWVFRSDERWPALPVGRPVQIHDEHGNPLDVTSLAGAIPETWTRAGEVFPLWSVNSAGAVVYRRQAADVG